jgi:uncharacterized protein (TIGR03435 family)
MRYAALAVSLVFASAAQPSAETQGSPTAGGGPQFEVASVKPTAPDYDGLLISGPTPGQFTTKGASLELLVRYAYGLRDYQIFGISGWMRTERFDIIAKYPNDESRSQVPQMVQALLTERFKLKVHRDTREGPIYALVLVRSDGQLGPKLRKNRVDCVAFVAARRKAGESVSFGGGRGEKLPPCMAVQTGDARDRIIMANGRTMTQFAGMISSAAGRNVIDRTGLMGEFDIELRWTPEIEPLSDREPLPAARVDDAVSLFTALQEQLGLRLEASKGPVDVLVIDSAERPAPD